MFTVVTPTWSWFTLCLQHSDPWSFHIHSQNNHTHRSFHGSHSLYTATRYSPDSHRQQPKVWGEPCGSSLWCSLIQTSAPLVVQWLRPLLCIPGSGVRIPENADYVRAPTGPQSLVEIWRLQSISTISSFYCCMCALYSTLQYTNMLHEFIF